MNGFLLVSAHAALEGCIRRLQKIVHNLFLFPEDLCPFSKQGVRGASQSRPIASLTSSYIAVQSFTHSEEQPQSDQLGYMCAGGVTLAAGDV